MKTEVDTSGLTIAIDAMGGDHSPGAVVEGVRQVCEDDFQGTLLLTGQQEAILACGPLSEQARIIPAADIVSMQEPPRAAVRKKPDSSLGLSVQLVKQGQAQAVISAGNTGAFMAFAVTVLGRVPGITRPAIATLMPTRTRPCILMDVGANVDCRAEFLVDFAVMGKVYTEKVLRREKPRVGLLNIGEEASKGNELTAEAYPMLEKAPINFVGNVEGADISSGEVDVVVCDGFVGNVILKYGEGLAEMVLSRLREIFTSASKGAEGGADSSILRHLMAITDYSEYGGAPLLGVDGSCIVCHGKSSPKAIANAIRVACRAIQNRIPETISEEISAVHQGE